MHQTEIYIIRYINTKCKRAKAADRLLAFLKGSPSYMREEGFYCKVQRFVNLQSNYSIFYIFWGRGERLFNLSVTGSCTFVLIVFFYFYHKLELKKSQTETPVLDVSKDVSKDAAQLLDIPRMYMIFAICICYIGWNLATDRLKPKL